MGFSPSRNLLPLSYQKTAQKETLFFFEKKGDENRPFDPHRITGNKSILLFVDFCIFADSGDLRQLYHWEPLPLALSSAIWILPTDPDRGDFRGHLPRSFGYCPGDHVPLGAVLLALRKILYFADSETFEEKHGEAFPMITRIKISCF